MFKESELSPSVQKHITELLTRRKKSPHYKDPDAQAFDNKFVKLVFFMEEKEQEQFVKLYLQHIVGVTIEDSDWRDEAGRRLNGAGDQPLNDGVKFWQDVSQSIPKLFSEDELTWLIQKDPDASGAFNMLCYMAFWTPRSQLVTKLMASIHAWK